ncbi:MAG: glycogen synthase GlgA [Rhodospirillales bacterium]|nr:glycogen synthase GlgA [Rhodospirillales bacterium]
MKVLFTVPEMYPFVKTGGLGDVAGALPIALRNLGVDIRTMIPAYPEVLDKVAGLKAWKSLGDPLGAGEIQVALGHVPGSRVPVWLVKNKDLFERKGSPYLGPDGKDWPDNHVRFAALSRAAAMVCDAGAVLGWQPDILHSHDWQGGLAPAYLALRGGRRPGTVFTIHNMAFAGIYPASELGAVGLPLEAFSINGVEYHKQLSFLKAGIRYADRLTTVSPTHAREIMSQEFGFGFEGILASRALELRGILNGIDADTWNPGTDAMIEQTYNSRSLAKKAVNKAALQKRFGLPVDAKAPLLGVVSRFTIQKGIDLVLEVLPEIVNSGAQLVVLGSGETDLEKKLAKASKVFPDHISIRIGYDEPLSHLVQSGSDLFLVPSRFEPCGLTQMYALRYGTPPIVRRTGGLADSVLDASRADGGTGFVFEAADGQALNRAITRAIEHYRRPREWRALQRRAMKQDFSWENSAREYISLYRELTDSALEPAKKTKRVRRTNR